jgi:hypothetical protein
LQASKPQFFLASLFGLPRLDAERLVDWPPFLRIRPLHGGKRLRGGDKTKLDRVLSDAKYDRDRRSGSFGRRRRGRRLPKR